jgi:hypothetical protein
MVLGRARLARRARYVKAEKSHHSRNLKAVWSEATELKLFFHVIHHRVQIIFFQKNVRQADAVFFIKALGG